MSNDSTRAFLIIGVVLCTIIGMFWLYGHKQAKRDTENQIIGMVKHFCSSHGGIGEDLTGEIESSYRHFTVSCVDGSSASGSYKDPVLVTFYDKDLNEIEH